MSGGGDGEKDGGEERGQVQVALDRVVVRLTVLALLTQAPAKSHPITQRNPFNATSKRLCSTGIVESLASDANMTSLELTHNEKTTLFITKLAALTNLHLVPHFMNTTPVINMNDQHSIQVTCAVTTTNSR